MELPQYTISFHQRGKETEDESHFDLFLETDTGLATWRIPILDGDVFPPPLRGSVATDIPPFFATKLPDHRTEYLNYEGEISGGRGTVFIQETGTYRVTDCDSLAAGIAEGKFTLQMTADIHNNGVDGGVIAVQFIKTTDTMWTLQ